MTFSLLTFLKSILHTAKNLCFQNQPYLWLMEVGLRYIYFNFQKYKNRKVVGYLSMLKAEAEERQN